MTCSEWLIRRWSGVCGSLVCFVGGPILIPGHKSTRKLVTGWFRFNSPIFQNSNRAGSHAASDIWLQGRAFIRLFIIFIIIDINILGMITSNQRTCMFMFMSRVPENRFWIGPKKDRRTKLRRDGRASGRSGSDEVRQTKMNFFARNYHNRTFIKKGSFKFNT